MGRGFDRVGTVAIGGWVVIALLLGGGLPGAAGAPPTTMAAISTTYFQSSELSASTTAPFIDFTAKSSLALFQALPLEVSPHVREVRIAAEVVDAGHGNWVDRTGGVRQRVTFSIDVVPRDPVYGTHVADVCDDTGPETTILWNAPHDGGALGRFALMTQLGERACTRSNIFAVWITTGFFQVSADGETHLRIDHRLEASVDVRNPVTGEPWLDIRFPAVTDSTTRRYKPLFAFFLMDLDGMVDVNYLGGPRPTSWEGRGGVRAPAVQDGNTTLVVPKVDFLAIQRELNRIQHTVMTTGSILQSFHDGARLAIQAIR
jgi:hypothetical protein